MPGVGLPGYHKRGGGDKTKQQAYRHSEAGMMARKMRALDPQVKARRKALRDAHKKMAH